MAHYVICPKCGKKFDTEKEQAVKVSTRRYGHATCYPKNEDFVPMLKKKEKEKTNNDLEELKGYINYLFGKKANWARITKQIKIYHEKNGYSYNSIKLSLKYFYEVQKNNINKSNGGIGIVPFVWQDSYNYYYKIFLANQANNKKKIKRIRKNIVIKKPISKRIKNKLLDIDKFL